MSEQPDTSERGARRADREVNAACADATAGIRELVGQFAKTPEESWILAAGYLVQTSEQDVVWIGRMLETFFPLQQGQDPATILRSFGLQQAALDLLEESPERVRSQVRALSMQLPEEASQRKWVALLALILYRATAKDIAQSNPRRATQTTSSQHVSSQEQEVASQATGEVREEMGGVQESPLPAQIQVPTISAPAQRTRMIRQEDTQRPQQGPQWAPGELPGVSREGAVPVPRPRDQGIPERLAEVGDQERAFDLRNLSLQVEQGAAREGAATALLDWRTEAELNAGMGASDGDLGALEPALQELLRDPFGGQQATSIREVPILEAMSKSTKLLSSSLHAIVGQGGHQEFLKEKLRCARSAARDGVFRELAFEEKLQKGAKEVQDLVVGEDKKTRLALALALSTAQHRAVLVDTLCALLFPQVKAPMAVELSTSSDEQRKRWQLYLLASIKKLDAFERFFFYQVTHFNECDPIIQGMQKKWSEDQMPADESYGDIAIRGFQRAKVQVNALHPSLRAPPPRRPGRFPQRGRARGGGRRGGFGGRGFGGAGSFPASAGFNSFSAQAPAAKNNAAVRQAQQ